MPRKPRWISAGVIFLPALLLGCGGLPSTPPVLPTMPDLGDEVVALGDHPERWFDFWLGSWTVQNLHVRRSGKWEETGEARADIQLVAGGNAVLERWTGEAKGRLIGSSVRSWNPQAKRWDVYLNWHSGKPNGFFVMHGERDGEALHLYPPGDKSSTRYTFALPRTQSAQWSEALYRGGHWITDWVMQFVRAGEAQPVNARTEEPTPPPAGAEKFEETRSLDAVLGRWSGSVSQKGTDGKWLEGTATVVATSMLEGFAQLLLVDTSFGEEYFSMWAFDPGVNAWVAIVATSEELGLTRLVGSLGQDGVTFAGDGRRMTWSGLGDEAIWKTEREIEPGQWEPELQFALTRSVAVY